MMTMGTRMTRRMIVRTIECSNAAFSKAAKSPKSTRENSEFLARDASFTTSIAKRSDCIIA
jgi:hypothetical protein